jgi:dihydroxyacetone kinase phosphoprotein-dependent L subunit
MMTSQDVPTTQGVSRLESIVRIVASTCVESEQYFCDLDAVAGDGDFGYSLARGFENVLASWDGYDRSDLGAFLRGVASTMSGRIGGTSGPIWGTAFLRAATVARGKEVLTGPDVVAMLTAAIEGIKARGGAAVGDKTVLDALVPLTDAVADGVADGEDASSIAARAAVTARAAADKTSELMARRGRASYTGERSVGSPDPGAVAVALLAERVATNW